MTDNPAATAAYALVSALILELAAKGVISVDEMRVIYARASKDFAVDDPGAKRMLSATLETLTLIKPRTED